MARRYAPVLCSIWDDPDFQQRTPAAQRLYILLLSQKKMSMVGVVPYSPRNWSRGSTHTTVDDIETALLDLIEHGYVLVDFDTDELLVRTMVKHDPPKGPKSRSAMWRSLAAVDSIELQRAVALLVPPDVWESNEPEPPDWAKPLRNAPSDAPSDAPSHPPSDGARAHADARARRLRPPASGLRPPSTSTSSVTDEFTRGDRPPVENVVTDLATRFSA